MASSISRHCPGSVGPCTVLYWALEREHAASFLRAVAWDDLVVVANVSSVTIFYTTHLSRRIFAK